MKKTLLASLLVAGTLSLTGCSTVGFDDIKLTITPEWDTNAAAVSGWGNDDFSSEDRDTILPSYIKLYNENKSCYIDGRIAYNPPDLAKEKDEVNSKQYLESLGLQNIGDKKFEVSQTNINDVRYVVGEYQLPPSFGQYSYHKTAVRVFSSAVSINQLSENQKGLPLVIVDMGCKNKEDINSKNWDKASSFFKLILSEYNEPVNNSYEDPILPEKNENADIKVDTPPVVDGNLDNVPPSPGS